MKQKELENRMAALESQVAELKSRAPIAITYPQVPCPLQHYPIHQNPNTYPYQPYTPVWCQPQLRDMFNSNG